jgi:hypothetical protein
VMMNLLLNGAMGFTRFSKGEIETFIVLVIGVINPPKGNNLGDGSWNASRITHMARVG